MKDDFVYLRHILDAIACIQDFLKETDHETFMNNRMHQDSIMRELAVIGEAASKISDTFRKQNSRIPFEHMIGLRHRLIHGYIDVDLSIVWQTSTEDLKPLKDMIETTLENYVQP